VDKGNHCLTEAEDNPGSKPRCDHVACARLWVLTPPVVIGASFEVHKFLGNGFQEVIYQRALAYEIRKAGLGFAREIEQERK